MLLSELLINWYLRHKRDLPWRHTQNPYLVWLSEVILQQTRVEQGLPYYYRFTERYPSVKDLAAAKDDDVMKLWQGLGYYNRAANMLKTARLIVNGHGGVFPGAYEGLISLKGIGPYTAAAISSFAFNEAQAVVDGNVFRVLSRLFAVDEPVNSTKGKKTFTELAAQLLDPKQPGMHNQAIMELGALVCKPRQPLCEECPVRLHCLAYKNGTVNEYPVKIKKNKPRDRYLSYIFIEQDNHTYIIQRTGSGIWQGLYELPNVESEAELDEGTLLSHPGFVKLFGKINGNLELLYSAKHQLTHQTIYANFFRLHSPGKIVPAGKDYLRVELPALPQYAVPRLFDKFLNYLNLHSNA